MLQSIFRNMKLKVWPFRISDVVPTPRQTAFFFAGLISGFDLVWDVRESVIVYVIVIGCV